LAHGDRIVESPKPRRPDWMDEETYAALPDVLRIREVRLVGTRPGFRTRTVIVATTLLDAEEFSAGELTELYRQRRHAKLDLRSLKQSMHLDDLRCQSPDTAHREIRTHLLAYNPIRTVMAQAAATHDVAPRTISFEGTIRTLLAFQPQLAHCRSEDYQRHHAALLAAVASLDSEHPQNYAQRIRARSMRAIRNANSAMTGLSNFLSNSDLIIHVRL
jgi:hypothetical protein